MCCAASKGIGKLLERVAKGEEIVITKHAKPVARLVPEGGLSLKGVSLAVAGLKELRERIATHNAGKKKLSYADFKSAVAEGSR
jgi:antitoxin (DNA-binding transcriptional repressor) of toxin-antitoxin stability system